MSQKDFIISTSEAMNWRAVWSLVICFILHWALMGQNTSPTLFQLAKPIVNASATFFTNQTEIYLTLGLDQVQLHYTLDGSEPTEQSPKYKQPIVLVDNTILKAKAFHDCCQSSETIQHHFYKTTELSNLQSIQFQTTPDPRYPGKKKQSLHDQIKAGIHYRDSAWLGISDHDFIIHYTFTQPSKQSGLTVSTLSDPLTWIFPPIGLELWGSDDGQNYQCLAKDSFLVLKELEGPQFRYYSISCPSVEFTHYRVVIRNTQTIPDWHLRAGKGSWLFIDEIIWQ